MVQQMVCKDYLLPLLQPLHVVCPEQYTQPPLTQSHRSDLMLELQPPPMPYRRCSVLNLPFRRRYERVYILPEVSQSRNSCGYEYLFVRLKGSSQTLC